MNVSGIIVLFDDYIEFLIWIVLTCFLRLDLLLVNFCVIVCRYSESYSNRKNVIKLRHSKHNSARCH